MAGAVGVVFASNRSPSLIDSRVNRFARAKQFSRLFKQIHGLPSGELAARTLLATQTKRG
jgi:hypothetical protein